MRLLNYIFWGCGFLTLITQVSWWWLLATPIWLLLYILCDMYFAGEFKKRKIYYH